MDVGAATCMLADFVIDPKVAVILDVPAPKAVATPAAFTVATVVVAETHLTEAVMSWLLPSLY
jgi:hypothetical protein